MAPLCEVISNIYNIYIVAPSVVGFLVTIYWLHQARLAWHHPIGWKKAAFWPLKASQIDWHIITYVVQDAYVTLLLNNYAWNKVIFRCKLSFSSIIVLKNSKDYMTTVADHIWFELVYPWWRTYCQIAKWLTRFPRTIGFCDIWRIFDRQK